MGISSLLCGLDDDEDFTASTMCCACGGGASNCYDTNDGTLSATGEDCLSIRRHPKKCAISDDDADFTSSTMCCICGGGFRRTSKTGRDVENAFGNPAVDLLQPSPCVDQDGGATAAHGLDCSMLDLESCDGRYDDSDFSSLHMCCVCGGGHTFLGEQSMTKHSEAHMAAMLHPDPVHAQLTATRLATGAEKVCMDVDHGSMGSGGFDCSMLIPESCDGRDDDSDFTALSMCCICGGGKIHLIPPRPVAMVATTVNTSAAASRDVSWYCKYFPSRVTWMPGCGAKLDSGTQSGS